jgi:hypothetical protein
MPKVISLLNANVDIDGMPWLNSCIPLYHAIVKQNTDMISYLLNRGARVELACGKNAGPNLLYCSGQTRNAMVLKIIAQHWEGNSTDLITGYTGALYGCLKDCIGYNQNQSPGAKYYPAKLWGTQSYFNAVTCFITEELIRDGADVNGKDFAGVTPLHLAIEAHRKDLALMLIRYGAKSDTPDNQGFTPRIIAKQKGMGDLFTNKNLHTPNARR